MKVSAPVQRPDATVLFSTDDFSEWCHAISQAFVPLHVSTGHAENFMGKIRSRSMGDILITEITAGPHHVERTQALISRSEKRYYKLSLQLSGTGLLIQDDREAILRPGDIAIYDTDRPYTLTFDSDFRSLVVMFPQMLIDLPRDAVGRLTATRIPGDEGLTRLVGPFLTHLMKNMDRLTGHSGMRLVHNTLDLVSTVLHSELDSRGGENQANHRATRVQEIRAYIDEHLSDPDLSPAGIAAVNFISTRHLHGIFKDQEVTVSAWIRGRRLENCRRDLADPLFFNTSVAMVGARWGFMDASHFSRLFRATFGQTPSDFRMHEMEEFRRTRQAS
ncbi:MAG: helix-turn-helix domain-containing protein [Actinomycetales bacterium]|nr:helix-turn-helix domain-containing protein [Actinomycetales bacterium]